MSRYIPHFYIHYVEPDYDYDKGRYVLNFESSSNETTDEENIEFAEKLLKLAKEAKAKNDDLYEEVK